jgi:cell division septation protein DedD
MPRNDDGEFELVLGNKQLLSVFFLVIVLLGVFFAMGYIMGRSGTTTQIAEMKTPDNSPTARPIVVDAGGAGSRPSAAGAPVVTREEVKPEPVRAEPTRTEPARTEPAKPEPVKPEPPKVVEKKPEPVKPDPPKAVAAAAVGGVPAGSYLQVAAVKKPEADIVSSLVAKKGYRAFLVPLKEGSDVYRVLVGPARDAGQQGKMLEDLKAEGFKPFPRRL